MCAIRIPAMAVPSLASKPLLRRALLLHSFLSPASRFSSLRAFPYLPPLTSSGLGMCHLAQAIKGDTDNLLKGVADKGVIEEVKHILEMAKRASLRREVLHTDFLTPPVLKESMLQLEKLADVRAVAQGGYPEAERCRLSVGHPEALTNDPDIVAALSISGNFGFQTCSHGDVLGSVLGTGIVRDKLGDIMLQGEKGAHILIVPELVDFLTSSLDKVGNVPVTCKKIPLLALEYEPPRTKTFKTVEASLRIDSIASAGFKISRSKLVDLIRQALFHFCTICFVNSLFIYLFLSNEGSYGKGRLKIGEVKTTKKGKFAVELIRYL
ncbi:hypothetical protein LguiA_023105 [Lonicera macranthoides]